MESCCIYSSPNSSSTAQYRLFSTDPSEDGRNLDAKIAKIELEIPDVANQIAKVEEAIASAKTSKDLDYFRTEKDRLRAEKDRLREKELLLKLKLKLSQDAPVSFSKPQYVDVGIKFVNSVIHKDPMELGKADGKLMRVLVGVHRLKLDAPPVDLFIRHDMKSFWEHCFELTEELRVCVVGTPGIGKSLSALFAIKLLLERRKRVVYLYRSIDRGSVYYQFTPGSKTVAVDVFPEKFIPSEIPSLRDPNTFYIVDPGKTKDSCDPSFEVKARVIICSSPDSRHWGENEFKKPRGEGEAGGAFECYPIWSLEELLVAGEHLRASAKGVALPPCTSRTLSRELFTEDDTKLKPFSADLITSRFRRFGGVPRIVFTTNLRVVGEYAFEQQRAVAALTDRQLRQLTDEDVDVDASKTDAPKSAVVGYVSRQQPVLISEQVERLVANKFVYTYWNYAISEHKVGVKSSRFEAYVQAWLLKLRLDTFSSKKLSKSGQLSKSKTSERLDLPHCGSSTLIRGHGSNVAQWSAVTEDLVLYCPESEQAPVVDFVIKKKNTYYAINATIESSRKVNGELLQKLYDVLNGAFAKTSNKSTASVKLKVVFAVPTSKALNKFSCTFHADSKVKQLPANCELWAVAVGPPKQGQVLPKEKSDSLL